MLLNFKILAHYTIVEEPFFSKNLDSLVKKYPNARKAWEGFTFIVSQNPEIGEPMSDGIHRLYSTNVVYGTKRFFIIFRPDNEKQEIVAVSLIPEI